MTLKFEDKVVVDGKHLIGVKFSYEGTEVVFTITSVSSDGTACVSWGDRKKTYHKLDVVNKRFADGDWEKVGGATEPEQQTDTTEQTMKNTANKTNSVDVKTKIDACDYIIKLINEYKPTSRSEIVTLIDNIKNAFSLELIHDDEQDNKYYKPKIGEEYLINTPHIDNSWTKYTVDWVGGTTIIVSNEITREHQVYLTDINIKHAPDPVDEMEDIVKGLMSNDDCCRVLYEAGYRKV